MGSQLCFRYIYFLCYLKNTYSALLHKKHAKNVTFTDQFPLQIEAICKTIMVLGSMHSQHFLLSTCSIEGCWIDAPRKEIFQTIHTIQKYPNKNTIPIFQLNTFNHLFPTTINLKSFAIRRLRTVKQLRNRF